MLLSACRSEERSSADLSAALHVGSSACAQCHPQQTASLRGSDHDRAMEVADETSVLGRFDGSTFTHAGITSTFSLRDGKHVVRTDGPDGSLQEFEVAYTFGFRPLQQYLIALPGGRMQALSIAWDSRPAAAGGQRWFHLYPDEAITHTDPLHWTGREQNWNSMCAECHSTDVHKNYRPEADVYETRWAELDVACEACHGPGSRHVAWARAMGSGAGHTDPGNEGLVFALPERDGGIWLPDPATGISRRNPPRRSHTEMEMCARCHSRRALLSEDYVHGRPLLDTHRPALLEPGLYFADGQIQDEVYEYGSFLQSRMYAAGVTCSDCHDPHSLELRRPGNALCAGCHAADRFDTAAHHFHAEAEPPVACVDCHMTSRRYMEVDVRRDHSFRVPRPDLSVELGVPNACNGCHADRSAAWSAAQVEQWYGTERRPHYADALQAGRGHALDAEARLVALAGDPARPTMARATALAMLGGFDAASSRAAIERALTDPDPLLRFGALQAAQALDLELRARVLVPLLRDPVRSLRAEAARLLVGVPASALQPQQSVARDAALSEYRSMQALGADRPEAHLNLGLLETDLGRAAESERQYRAALRIDPAFVPAYANLADLYRSTGRDAEGEAVLREALRIAPESAAVHHALGLLLVRLQRQGDSLAELARAAELDPDFPRYAYVHAVALQSAGDLVRSLEVLDRSHQRHPADREILAALATFTAQTGDRAGALIWARKLVALAPQDPGARQFLADLEASDP